MNALTLRGIVAEELGSLKLHVIGKCGGLGELRKTCWARELPGFGTRHYASGRKVYIVQARMEGRTRTVTIGNAKVLSRVQAMDVARRVLLRAQTGENPAEERKRLRKVPSYRDFLKTYWDRMTAHNTLAGKTALVTGSVQGIGLAIARSLARAGMRIAVHGLASTQEGEAVAVRLRDDGAGDARFFDADLRDPRATEAMMMALDEWGPVDVLINNAGIQKTAPFDQIDRATWDAVIAINLSAAFDTMRLALPGMARRGYGRVINIASVHGIVASRNKAPYCAAKHGLVGMSRVAALEYAAAGDRRAGGVTVNCICPGWTETDMIAPQIAERGALMGVDRDDAIASLLSEKQPSLRMSDPGEIGELALWLCSPVAHNVTGVSIPVDGGWTAQ